MSLSHTEEMRLVKAVERITESLKSIDKSLKTFTPKTIASLDNLFFDKVDNDSNDAESENVKA